VTSILPSGEASNRPTPERTAELHAIVFEEAHELFR